MKWPRVIIGSAAAGVILFAGYRANLTAYYDHSPYWGIPVRMQQDDTALIAKQHAMMEVEVTVLPSKIAKLRETVGSLVQQQQYLYNELFKSMVKLEQESRMLPEAIAKIGPMANMDLRDLTGTDRALDAVNQYQVDLPLDSMHRNMTSGLLMNFNQVKDFKRQFIERMYMWQAENPIVVEYTPPSYIYVTPEAQVDENGYVIQPETQIIEESPATQSRTWNISEEDGKLLGMTHKLHTDIDLVQIRLVKTTLDLVRSMKLLGDYQTRLAASEENPAVRVAKAEGQVHLMFMQAKSKPYVWEGQQLRKCWIGVLFCHNVGRVKEVFSQPHKLPHVDSGKSVEGFLVEIDLDDESAMKSRVLHVHNHALY